MQLALTNLLPEARQRSLRRAYFLRLVSVTILCVTFLTLAAGALMLPTYVYLAQSIRTKEARLQAVEAALSSGDEAALSARLTALSEDARLLAALGTAPSVSGMLASALDVPHPGIALTTFTYTPAAAKAPATIAFTGVAATRSTLRNYQLALEAAPFVRSADLPVSAYAKEANSAFTITLTLTAPSAP